MKEWHYGRARFTDSMWSMVNEWHYGRALVSQTLCEYDEGMNYRYSVQWHYGRALVSQTLCGV